MSDGAGAVLFNTDEVEIQVKDGVATIANQSGFIGVGFDGSNYRFFRTNTSGQQVFVGAGVAGTPAGGVASVQGVAGGTALPISAASLPLPSGAATQATLAAVLVDTGQIEALLTTIDADTGTLAAVDYATQTTLAALAAEDFATQTTLATLATQTTLAAADVKLGTIDAVLDAIKDTDGVADLAAWLGSSAPTVGQKAMLASIPVTFASDQSALSVTSGAAVGVGAIAELLLDGGSSDMVVNGSGTPVEFSFGADPTNDIALTSLRLVITVGGAFDFNGDTFGDGGSALATGVEVQIVANNGAFDETVMTLTTNEDFARLLDFQPFSDIDAILTALLPFGADVVLVAGTSDKIAVVINDNVAQGVRGIDYFTATAYGYLS